MDEVAAGDRFMHGTDPERGARTIGWTGFSHELVRGATHDPVSLIVERFSSDSYFLMNRASMRRESTAVRFRGYASWSE
jgi:hypothetical protein